MPEQTNLEFKKIKSEYEKEEKGLLPAGIFGGSGVGAAIGLAICLLLIYVSGLSLSLPEIATIVGSLVVLGGVTGYITS